ncbi:hypothetical protein ABLE91_17040 [Aquabacter sp. CN5-332]|uniref:hypothetical protein n=1 Tax=Aquabacter sp. CN5-332 TaxID=3156608 RepID=UPI0032B4AFB1
MHKYRLEFSSETLNEARLRDVLEREFKIASILIVRDTPVLTTTSAPKATSDTQKAVVSLLSDGKPWRRKAILLSLMPAVPQAEVANAIVRMLANGLMKKVQHGVYLLNGVEQTESTQIPRLNRGPESPTVLKAMDLLSSPRSASFLRIELGVTRQRVDQMTKKLMAEGRIRRFPVSGEQGAFIYVRTENAGKETILLRAPNLHETRGRIISTFLPETLARFDDIASLVRVAGHQVKTYLQQLSTQGLVITFKLGNRSYAAITPRGLDHPQYDRDAVKVTTADPLRDFGRLRARFIQILDVLGEAKTIDLTYGLPFKKDIGRANGSGQVVQRLTQSGLIQKISVESGRHSGYRLTKKGEFVAAVLKKHIPEIDVSALHERIRMGHEGRIREIRQRVLSKGRGAASTTQDSIIGALKAFGPLSTSEIQEKMDTKFTNPKSINLALRTLERRSVIVCLGVAGRGRAKTWAIKTE